MPSAADARRIVRAVEPHADVFKVGLTSFVGGGRDLVPELAARTAVFLDLKLHDIPAQVSGAVAAAGELGASYVTVHAAGGPAMVGAAADAAPPSLTVLAVTILTSLSAGDLDAIGIAGTPADAVDRLADVALAAGATGLVCSALEVAGLRRRLGPRDSGGPILVVPGIRSPDAPPDDQRRTLAPAEAVAAGADVLVVGRPVTRSPDPTAAAAALAASIAAAGARRSAIP